MIARITATKQHSAAVYAAAVEPEREEEHYDLLKDFKNVSLAGYQAEMRSPTKSMRQQTASEQRGKQFDEYEHKDSDTDRTDPFGSPPRVGKASRAASHEVESPSTHRRTIQETYMSPKRLSGPGSTKRDDDGFQPSITHSPLRRDAAASPPTRRPVYNSMMGGFDQKDDDFPRREGPLYGVRPQSAARQAPVSAGRHSLVNVVSHSESDDEAVDASSSDSSDAGTHEKVHIQQTQRTTAADNKAHPTNTGRQEYKSSADYYEQREYGTKIAVDAKGNSTRVMAAAHVIEQRHDPFQEDRALEAAALNAAAAAGARKKITVARSPKFSQMSWQRRGGGDAPTVPAAAPLPAPGQDKRSSSTGRHRVAPSLSGHDGHAPRAHDEEVAKAKEKPSAPLPSYMQSTGSHAASKRSDSASRTRR
jgi:hypothetical protein